MRFGDVVFEGGRDAISGAIKLSQLFLPGKDHRITHALIVVGRGLAVEADVKPGVHFRTFDKPSDLDNILYVMRADKLQIDDEKQQHALVKAGIEAFLAFLGEKYSFGQIMLHKFDARLATDMPETLGATFCSALVKRILTVAGLADGLSNKLLMSPSELHAELSDAAGWKPVSLEEFGRTTRGLSESELASAKKLVKLRNDYSKDGALFAKGNRVLIDGFTNLVATEDAAARLVFEMSKVNLVHNVFYPYDMIKEATAARWWDELGNLIGRARWTIAASRSEFEAQRKALANDLVSALPRLVKRPEVDPSQLFLNKVKALYDAGDIDGMVRLSERIDPLILSSVTRLYTDAHDVFAKADDKFIRALALAIDVRLSTIDGIEDVRKFLIGLLANEPKRA